jgi:hypothetical protein
MMFDWANLLMGALIGTIVTSALTHVYYRQSKKDLRRLEDVLTRALRAGLIEVTRDRAGRIEGIKRPNPPGDLSAS